MSNDDIVQEVITHELSRLSKRSKFKESFDSRLSDQAQHVKTVILGIPEEGAAEVTEEDIVAANLSNTYYGMLRSFKGKLFSYPKVGESSKQSKSFWHRVAVICISIHVDPVVYLKAQFIYFRNHFGRPPEFCQLATASAAARATEYASKSPSTRTYVAAKATPVKISLSEKMTTADKKVRSVCKAQGLTRFELYQNLVIPGFLLLPKEYLKADPEYKRALNG